jgi:hypothetical protein
VHSIRCLKLAGGGTNVHIDIPDTFPNASERARRSIGNPVATAQYYRRMLRHYFAAFLNWPWGEDRARGPGIFAWIRAYNAATEMQRGGMLHLHGLLHCLININQLLHWLNDKTKQQKFFAYVDSIQVPQLPETMQRVNTDPRGDPFLTFSSRTLLRSRYRSFPKRCSS